MGQPSLKSDKFHISRLFFSFSCLLSSVVSHSSGCWIQGHWGASGQHDLRSIDTLQRDGDIIQFLLCSRFCQLIFQCFPQGCGKCWFKIKEQRQILACYLKVLLSMRALLLSTACLDLTTTVWFHWCQVQPGHHDLKTPTVILISSWDWEALHSWMARLFCILFGERIKTGLMC